MNDSPWLFRIVLFSVYYRCFSISLSQISLDGNNYKYYWRDEIKFPILYFEIACFDLSLTSMKWDRSLTLMNWVLSMIYRELLEGLVRLTACILRPLDIRLLFWCLVKVSQHFDLHWSSLLVNIHRRKKNKHCYSFQISLKSKIQIWY